MPILSSKSVRFARAWFAGPVESVAEELTLDRGGITVPATIARPAGTPQPLPAWVVLHGITRAGRAHLQLARFTHALVSTGAVAIVPEVPEWRELDFAPDVATPTVGAAIRGLRDSGWALDAPVGVIGFSFGAPHAIASSADPTLSELVAHSVGFGGYCNVESTFRFMMTGLYEREGRTVRVRPDPYGRWLVAANYLAEAPEHRDADDVADALRSLAAHSGDVGAPSWDAVYDPVIAKLRAGIAPERRQLFDLFAPASGALPILPDDDAADRMAETLARAAHRTDPLLDPRERLARVERPVHVLHGRDDVLIPCSEAYEMDRALPSSTPRQVTVTRLFGHSSQNPLPTLLRATLEVPRFARALRGMLEVGNADSAPAPMTRPR